MSNFLSSQSKVARYVFAYLLLLLIAVGDYYTGSELSSSILYFFPIFLITSHSNTKRIDVIFVALTCGSLWLLANMGVYELSSFDWVFIWNSGVRFAIFFLLAFFIYRNEKERRRVQEVNQQLVAINEEKNKYLGVAAHDIRSPLGSINNLAMLLREDADNLTSQQIKFISVIEKLSHDGLDLLNNILDITQIESGSLKIKPVEHEYIGFVRDTIENNLHLAEKKLQKIHFEPTDASLLVKFDPSYLSQVLNNLITNAIKYSYPESSIIIRVAEDDGAVMTSIEDKGVGIKEEDKEKVFRPFERAQNRPTAGEHSTGLGLTITNKIVEAHNGKMGVNSKVGQGSTFYFTLPL